MTRKDIFDITIIGGGPAGLYSAFYSGLREMKTKIIEYQPILGGKLQVYPEKMIWDVGGVPPSPGATLMKQLVNQALTFQPTVVLQEKVISISKNEKNIFELHTESGHIHYSKTVIVAVGSGILNPKKLNINGVEQLGDQLTNLHYAIPSLEQFKDKTVLISGGGNSAIDWANELESIAKHVFIVCRNGDFTCHESQATQLKKSSVVCLFNSQITEFVTNGLYEIEKVELTNRQSGVVSYLPVDAVIVNHGYERDTSLLENTQLPIERVDHYFIKGTASSESSVPGLYAAGDILMHEGKLNLIAGAFQDAANAVNKAKQYIQPNAEQVAMVSSHHELLKDRNKKILQEKLKDS